MSLLVISDLHAHAWPRFARTLPNGQNSRFADLLHVLGQVEALLIHHKPEALVILGDLTHRRFFLQFSIYNTLMATLFRLARRVDKVLMIPGNHDYEAQGVHSLEPFQYVDGFEVLDEPCWYSLSVGLSYFVPYMETGVPHALREPVPQTAQALSPFGVFTHYALDGTVLDTEYQVRTPLTHRDLSGYERVYFGHVHSPFVQGRIVNVGAPMHFDFGDSGPRYAWMVDRHHTEAFTLRAPQFRTVRYPRIPAKPFDEEGYLRVQNVPVDLFADVKRDGQRLGWTEVVCAEAEVPPEVQQLIASGAFLTEGALREYVQTRFPELGDGQEAMVQAGLAFLSAADAGGRRR